MTDLRYTFPVRKKNELPSTSGNSSEDVKTESSLSSLEQSNSISKSPKSSRRKPSCETNKKCLSEWRRYRNELNRSSRAPLTKSEEDFYEKLDKRSRISLKRSRSRLKISRSPCKGYSKSNKKSRSMESNDSRPIRGSDDIGPNSIRAWPSNSGPTSLRRSTESETSPRRRSSQRRPRSILRKSDSKISRKRSIRILDSENMQNVAQYKERRSYRQEDVQPADYDNVCGCPWSLFKRCYQASNIEDDEEMQRTQYRKSRNSQDEKEMQRPYRESRISENVKERQIKHSDSRESKNESFGIEDIEMPAQYRSSRHSLHRY